MAANLEQRAAMASDMALRLRLQAALVYVARVVVVDNPLDAFPPSGTNQQLRDNAVRSRRRAFVTEVLAGIGEQAQRAAWAIAGTDHPAVDAYAASSTVTDAQLVGAVTAVWDVLATAV